MIHLDTSFLVDLLREVRRGRGPATVLFDQIVDQELHISLFVECELEMGAELSNDPEKERQKIEHLCSHFPRANLTDAFPRTFASVASHLRRNGRQIGNMDLLIATTALAVGASLVTGNEAEFSRVPNLEVISY